MNDTEFEALSEATLAQIEAAVEACGADIDLDRKDGGVLEIECAGGGRLIVNRQRPAREIWVAARSGGFHFRWDGAAWRDTRDGGELFAALSRILSENCGADVRLRP